MTNNGDRPISLVDARINFISSAGDKIPAAEPEDVERRMTHVGNAGKKIPMPAPLPSDGRKVKTPDSKIEQDFSGLSTRPSPSSRTPRVPVFFSTTWKDWATIHFAARS